ncbi:MAG: diguanylate cyclase with sensor [Frankiales bacterium]|nr:diguanylate cyclase with sensor [Frankiales bacterium]
MLSHPADAVVAPWVLRASELAGFATWTLDLESGAVTSSSRVRSHLDLAPNDPEPSLQDWFDVVHPEDKELLRTAWRGLVDEGREYVLDHRVVLPNGRLKHMRAVACVGTGADGRPLAYGITQDVTDVRLAAEQLARERDRSRAVVANLQEGFLLTTRDVVLEVNPALCALTGFTEEELVGAGQPFPFWPPALLAEFDALRERLAEEGGGKVGVELQRKDGRRFPASLTATPLPATDGPALWMVTVRDTTQEREHERLLLARAETDPLTGLLNSRAFRDALRRAARAARDDGGVLSLALLDVDHFKSVNDRFGHAVGDEVLCEVAQRLGHATAPAGILARVGGEEFALLMPGLDAGAAHRLLATALEAMRSMPFRTAGLVTASAGVAELLGEMDDDGLYRLADTLLYEAKARGRDQVR